MVHRLYQNVQTEYDVEMRLDLGIQFKMTYICLLQAQNQLAAGQGQLHFVPLMGNGGIATSNDGHGQVPISLMQQITNDPVHLLHGHVHHGHNYGPGHHDHHIIHHIVHSAIDPNAGNGAPVSPITTGKSIVDELHAQLLAQTATDNLHAQMLANMGEAANGKITTSVTQTPSTVTIVPAMIDPNHMAEPLLSSPSLGDKNPITNIQFAPLMHAVAPHIGSEVMTTFNSPGIVCIN